MKFKVFTKNGRILFYNTEFNYNLGLIYYVESIDYIRNKHIAIHCFFNSGILVKQIEYNTISGIPFYMVNFGKEYLYDKKGDLE